VIGGGPRDSGRFDIGEFVAFQSEIPIDGCPMGDVLSDELSKVVVGGKSICDSCVEWWWLVWRPG